MDPNQSLEQAKQKLEGVINHFNEELKKLRTGRAHPSMLDGIKITAYGTEMPLIQAATVTAPEAQLLQITPFDPNNLSAISEAIRNDQSLGFNPMDDGRVVRVQIPALTTERRQQIVKQLSEKVEESMIATRNIRHDLINDAKQSKSNKEITEDDMLMIEKRIDEAMTKTKAEIEGIAKTKEQEIMTV